MLKVFLVLALVCGMGCSKSTAPAPAETASPVASTNAVETAASADRKEFQVRGVVQELKLQENEIVIKHEEIPNYMPAMTMPFEVKNSAELNGIAPNDQVSFTMIVTETDGWIENIKKVGVSTEAPSPAPRPRTRLVRDVEPLEVGDKMSDYSFTNSLGEKFSLGSLKGQAYAFTFIFTRCPFPNFCPRMNLNFARAYEQLSSMPNAPTNWHLVSISFDPEYDTPARLKNYSATYNPDPKKWSWVTGAMIDIDAITEQMGMAFAYENNTYNHNLRTVVVDKNGLIRHIFVGNEWTPGELVKEILAGAKGEEIGEPQTGPEP
jgi:protein SCO1/2